MSEYISNYGGNRSTQGIIPDLQLETTVDLYLNIFTCIYGYTRSWNYNYRAIYRTQTEFKNWRYLFYIQMREGKTEIFKVGENVVEGKEKKVLLNNKPGSFSIPRI